MCSGVGGYRSRPMLIIVIFSDKIILRRYFLWSKKLSSLFDNVLQSDFTQMFVIEDNTNNRLDNPNTILSVLKEVTKCRISFLNTVLTSSPYDSLVNQLIDTTPPEGTLKQSITQLRNINEQLTGC